MNPALLLNPKNFRKNQKKQVELEKQGKPTRWKNGVKGKPPAEIDTSRKTPPPASPSKPKYDPLVLLTPSKRRNRTPTPEKTIVDPAETGEVNGINLIHRLHNVSERDQVASNKRKLVMETDGEDHKKAKFNGSSGGGMLGDALKKEAKEAAMKASPPSLSASNTVDLTGDDDDVVITGFQEVSNDDREVCLGMIEGAKVNASFIPMPKMRTFQGSSTMWPQIKVNLKREANDGTVIIRCEDPQFNKFGNIEATTAFALAPLMDSVKNTNLRCAAWTRPRRKRPGELPKMPCSEVFEMIIILYSRKESAKGIGNWLGQKNVWLRQPPLAMISKGTEYWNPQDPPKSRQPDEIADRMPRAGPATATPNYTRTVEETAGDMKELFDKLAKTESLPETETPADIVRPLLSHQKQALTFMLNREKDFGWQDENDDSEALSLWKVRHTANGNLSYYNTITGHELKRKPAPTQGGILADMMGLGKTLSMLSLIVSTKDQAREFADEAAVPRNPQRILKCNLKATLLVVPLSTIQNWEEQIRSHVKRDKLKFYVHHGASRVSDVAKLTKCDVVITCYPTLAAEFRRNSALNPMFDAQWFRIVLDEAHTIRNQTSGFFRSCCELMATRRWAVTGTPVQNRLEDLGALFQFLQVTPFDRTNVFNQYFIAGFKSVDPEILPKLRLLVDGLTLRRLKKDAIDLPPRTEEVVKLDMSEKERKMYDFFRADAKRSVNVITANGKLGSRSYAAVLKNISRLRRICAHGEELLNEEDLKIAQGLHKENAIEIADDDSDELPPLTDKQAMEMFYLLRESDLDHCETCNKKMHDAKEIDENDETDPANDTVGFMTSCYHVYCPACFDDFRTEVAESLCDGENDGYMNCPRCHQWVRTSLYELKQSEINKDQRNKAAIRRDQRMAKHLARYTGPHTKVIALLGKLAEFRQWSEENPDEPPIKSVIFSEWTNHLDLIQIALESAGHKYARIDGSVTRKNRAANIDTFRDDPSVTIMLATVGAAGLGLNFTVANKVFVMEPQYNPQAEAQAVDRVHRLGQTRPVTITWYIMNNSFEDQVREMQRKKIALADLSMDRKGHLSKADDKKKKLEDLRSLFK